MYKFSKTSLENLKTTHPKLQQLFNEVIKHVDCTIICGHRGKEAQEEAYRTSSSRAKWGESAHNTLPSMAVDVMPYPIEWKNMKRIYEFAGFVKGVASQLGIKIKWGGDFTTWFDGPHYELEE